jgi:hypothetical protein
MPIIQPPPLDSAGKVVPHDHQQIESQSEVIRRISVLQTAIGKNGNRIISTAAYNSLPQSDKGMSLDIKPFIEADGVDPAAGVTTPRWIGSVKFKAEDLRSFELKVGYDPIPPPSPDENPYHGQAWGDCKNRNKKAAIRSKAEWFVQIPDVDLDEV